MRKYKNSDKIFEKDTVCTKLAIVLEGSLNDEAGKEIVQKGQLFGDEFLHKNKREALITSSLIMNGDGVVAEI